VDPLSVMVTGADGFPATAVADDPEVLPALAG
jgi:hypothetical protein